jgi:thioredoxin
MQLQDVLASQEPVIMMLNRGESLAADVRKALESAQASGLKVVKVNIEQQPDFASTFDVGKYPVLMVWHCGDVVSRKSRPWGTDAVELVGVAQKLQPAPAAGATPKPAAPPKAEVASKPIEVTDKTFMEKVINSPIPVIVDFWADWCGPCKMVAPIFDKLAAEFAGRVLVAKVDVDANPMLSQQFRISSIPTMMFVKNGKIVGQSAGAAPEAAIRDVMKQLETLQV